MNKIKELLPEAKGVSVRLGLKEGYNGQEVHIRP
jgi:hypothetical protein